MALSGSVNFVLNRDQIIKDALIDVGAVAAEDSVSSDINEHAARLLNLMIKAWQADGLQLWKLRRCTLLLQKSTQKYTLGPNGDHFALTSDITETEMRVAAVATDTTMEVDSTTGMTAGDNVGVQLDGGTMHFTTIASVTDSDTFELTTAIPTGGAVAIDNDVRSYTNKAPRPLMIKEAFNRDASDNDRPMRMISEQEYWRLGSKDSAGAVVELFYKPTLTDGTLYVYPPASLVTDSLEMVCQFPLEDMDAAANDFDFPQEWLMALKLNLSVQLSPSYGVRREQFQHLSALAEKAKEDALGWDKEKVSVYIQPEHRSW